MKIFAFTDTHSNIRIIEKVIRRINHTNPDIVICSGDIADYEQKLDKIIKKLKQTKKLILIISDGYQVIRW